MKNWAVMIMMFLAKSARACTMTEHRGAALLECLLKWYCNCLIVLTETLVQPAFSTIGET